MKRGPAITHRRVATRPTDCPTDHRTDRGPGRRPDWQPPGQSNGQSNRGFTLLEILVALAVVAVALAALVGQASRNLENTARLRDHTLAHWVAMNVVTELQVNEEWPRLGERKGSGEMAGREWFWTLKVSSTADRNIRRLDVEVHRERQRRRALATAIAYVGRPGP